MVKLVSHIQVNGVIYILFLYLHHNMEHLKTTAK